MQCLNQWLPTFWHVKCEVVTLFNIPLQNNKTKLEKTQKNEYKFRYQNFVFPFSYLINHLSTPPPPLLMSYAY